MSELCVDASVAVKLVLKGESHRATARRLLKNCIVNNVALIAPPFFASEADTAIRKRVYDGLRRHLHRTCGTTWLRVLDGGQDILRYGQRSIVVRKVFT